MVAADSAVVIFAHGSRDPEWVRPFEALRARLEQRLLDTPIALAFLEQIRPDLVQVIGELADKGIQRVTVLPLFMAQGRHLREELPRIVARACEINPGVLVRTSAAVGEIESLMQAIVDWAATEHTRTRAADLGHPVA
ncbi:MAG: CbiX/SirB N-terminal domain-containing protein [Burkholderiales bacterium]|nr:CbiX/SirB N-terminal domain-containing protein [Burkholderiales bacterium]